MKIVNITEPFLHTIIYDYFSDVEVNSIIKEANTIYHSFNPLDLLDSKDEHHKSLITVGHTATFGIDQLYNGKRQNSAILEASTKIFILDNTRSLDYNKNRNLKYIHNTKNVTTYLNIYKTGSFYGMHDDDSVLTVLTILSDIKEKLKDCLTFPEFNYTPILPHNACIIFPSYELHQVDRVECYSNSSRISINQRMYI
jgi:Rps23 Pro-64 3,4-dihydroxylase Tpa1-like proline 4-hydroxylase